MSSSRLSLLLSNPLWSLKKTTTGHPLQKETAHDDNNRHDHNGLPPQPLGAPSKLKIQILSDLHLEVPRPSSTSYSTYQYDFPVTAPNLALLGDIGNTVDPALFKWLDIQLTRYQTLFFLAGNHEPYRSTFDESYALLERYAKKNTGGKRKGKFIFLNRTPYDVDDSLTILGCTLWANIHPDNQSFINITLNDFKKIKGFDPEVSVRAHQRDLEWLTTTIQQIRNEEAARRGMGAANGTEAGEAGETPRRIVVFTHHAPTVEDTMDPRYYQRPSVSAYATELSNTDWWSTPNTLAPLTFWAFGHTHYSCDFVRNGVRVYSNQRGRKIDDSYDPSEFVEL